MYVHLYTTLQKFGVSEKKKKKKNIYINVYCISCIDIVARVQQWTALIWIQEHSLKCLTPMFNLAAEEHYWVAWYKET